VLGLGLVLGLGPGFRVRVSDYLGFIHRPLTRVDSSSN